MTVNVVSTVPTVLQAVQTNMQAVASANPTLNAAVYMGQVIGAPANNFFGIGDPEGNGELFANYQSEFQGLFSEQVHRGEAYSILCHVRTWQGDVNPVARITEAFTLINGLANQIYTDKLAGGALQTPSSVGNWGLSNIQNHAAGKLDGKGWGCVFTFQIDVTNVVLGP
jgi:hypothetical protein